KQYGSATEPKGRRDFEYLIDELARLLRDGDGRRTRERMVGWLCEKLLPYVDYPSEIWRVSFEALHESIATLGPEAARAAPVLVDLAGWSDRLPAAAKLTARSLALAEQVAERVTASRPVPALFTPDEFRQAIAAAHRRLIGRLAVAWASDGPATDTRRL